MAVENALKSCPLFQDFTPTGLGIIAGIGQELSIPAGTPIFVQGMMGASMFGGIL